MLLKKWDEHPLNTPPGIGYYSIKTGICTQRVLEKCVIFGVLDVITLCQSMHCMVHYTKKFLATLGIFHDIS